MEHFDGPLRQIRNELIPRIPELAPHLLDEPKVIYDALAGALEARGIDPKEIPEVNINKTERHAIAGYCIGEQRKLLIEGEGREARFTTFEIAKVPRIMQVAAWATAPGKRYLFRKDLLATQFRGADRIERVFSHGSDRGHRWFPLAGARYAQLGDRAVQLVGKSEIPVEGHNLIRGMKTQALTRASHFYLHSIRKNTGGFSFNQRVDIAHDLTHLATGLASLHIKELEQLVELVATSVYIKAVKLDIRQETGNTYRGRYANAGERKGLSPHLKNLKTAKLKCPAHAAIPEAGQPFNMLDTNLQHFLHAVVNAAAEGDYKIL